MHAKQSSLIFRRSSTTDTPRTWESYLLWVAIAVVFCYQTSSLFTLPIPDSVRWRGDETWLMTEYREQIVHGVARYPQALGSTVSEAKGVVLGNVWLAAAIYGAPSLVFSSVSRVDVGRVVTLVLSILLIGFVRFVLRRLGASEMAAALAVLVMISNDAWLFASHSARPDLLAGLILLGSCYLVTMHVDEWREWSALKWFVFGLVTLLLAATASIHLLTFLGPLALFALYESGGWKRPLVLLSSIGGVLVAAGLLTLVYYISVGEVSLFNQASHSSQYTNEALMMPVLRPFSRSVQSSNLVRRLVILFHEAPASLILIFLGLVLYQFVRGLLDPRLQRFTLLVVLMTTCWLLFEGVSPNYTLHILPLWACGFGVVVGYASKELWPGVVRSMSFVAGLICATFGMLSVSRQSSFARDMDHEQRVVVDSVRALVHTQGAQQPPLVLVETPLVHQFIEDKSLRMMTDHFLSYPTERAAPYPDYYLVYNSPNYEYDRFLHEGFYYDVTTTGEEVGRWQGHFYDMGRDHSLDAASRDTLILYRRSEQR